MRSGLTRIVAVLPAVCRRTVPLRALLATSTCRVFSDDGDARGQHQEGAREQDGEAKSRVRRLSLATGSAVAALGASYILYNNHFKLKAQGELFKRNKLSHINKSADKSHVVVESNQKRKDYLEWSDYFMAVAFLSAQRSKDPSSQVGACIVSPEGKIVGTGYNGMPNGCSDDSLPWGKEEENWHDNKYPYVCHAEMNAILNKNSSDLHGCTLYVTLFPCNECAKLVIQSGIREVVYLSGKHYEDREMVAARRLLNLAGVTYRRHVPKQAEIRIDLSVEDATVAQTP